jgi:hypothetical protein
VPAAAAAVAAATNAANLDQRLSTAPPRHRGERRQCSSCSPHLSPHRQSSRLLRGPPGAVSEAPRAHAHAVPPQSEAEGYGSGAVPAAGAEARVGTPWRAPSEPLLRLLETPEPVAIHAAGGIDGGAQAAVTCWGITRPKMDWKAAAAGRGGREGVQPGQPRLGRLRRQRAGEGGQRRRMEGAGHAAASSYLRPLNTGPTAAADGSDCPRNHRRYSSC